MTEQARAGEGKVRTQFNTIKGRGSKRGEEAAAQGEARPIGVPTGEEGGEGDEVLHRTSLNERR
ncbi:hypothetical protein E2C01_043169 [Portunus trituberculatus]|uniref:Uncharacterized protein n=1 Tax=Portunus trituberculatus TaxID=210409 RepID=A0A5B7FNR3_PORTR|nr:hypothetical protein [Portunus trituberculatus]